MPPSAGSWKKQESSRKTSISAFWTMPKPLPWTEEPGRLQSMESLESDTTERLHFHFSLSCIGEGNGNPLQCSCLENSRDRGAWRAAVYGVAQSRTPRFPGPLLRRTRGPDPSSKANLWAPLLSPNGSLCSPPPRPEVHDLSS